MDTLTSKQRRILRHITSQVRKNGYPPTRSEIAEHFGVSRNAANDHVKALVRKGFLRLSPELSRGLTVLRDST